MERKKIIIIGSGIGGICCGIRLQKLGYQVTILEKESQPGGVTKTCHVNDFPLPFDYSASITIHPGLYEKVFTDVGLHAHNYYSYTNLEELYQIYDHCGNSFRLKKDVKSQQKDFEKFFGSTLKEYEAFITSFNKKYEWADQLFLTKNFSSCKDYLNIENIKAAFFLNPLRKADNAIKKRISSPLLRDFLRFQTYYMGLDPKKLSQIYATIPAVTQIQGLIHIDGGMGAYVDALIKAFTDLGGEIFSNEEVTAIYTKENCCKKKSVSSVQCKGNLYTCDILISNVDYYYTKELINRKSLKSNPKIQNKQMTCSVYIFRFVIDEFLPSLSVHNVYLSKNLSKELSLVTNGKYPEDPPLYVYYPAAIDDHFWQKHKTSLQIMVRIPHLGFSSKKLYSLSNRIQIDRLREICLSDLAVMTKNDDIKNHILAEKVCTPYEFRNHFHSRYGAAFGLKPTLINSLFTRPQSRDKTISNLYYVGTNAHPGNGVSLVMKGAEITAKVIASDQPL